MNTAETLPNNLDELKQIILNQNEEASRLNRKVKDLEAELHYLKTSRFKSKSEKLNNLGPDLFEGFIQETLESISVEPEPEKTKVAGYDRKKPKPRKLSKDLPRVNNIIEGNPEDKICDACGSEMPKIHEELSEQLAIIPAKHYVIRNIRYKYACSCKQCIKRATAPVQPIPKSQASAQLIAFLMVSKFIDGLPLYRLEKIFNRYGLECSRHTMSRWLILSSEHFDRLIEVFHQTLTSYDIASADETSLQVLKEPNKKQPANLTYG